MPKETKISRPSLTQNKEISFSCLAEWIGLEKAEITWRHLSPEAVRDDARTATCYTVAEARRRFSSKMANQGLQLFAADRGKALEQPSVIVNLATLASMLAAARGNPSIIDALAVSKELPAASPLTVRTGRRSELP